MCKKKRYIHIGFPKNFSTSLQRDYFGKHPQLYHLGIGYGDHNLGYIDHDISAAMEVHLRFSKEAVYQKEKANVIECFQRHFEKAENISSIRALGISSEHMSFNFTPDNIDPYQKAFRLAEIFEHDACIIMIIRNQMDLLQSLYRECVRIGYPYSYQRYMDYLCKFFERSFASDFLYYECYRHYADFFGAKNIKIFTMEEARKDGILIRKGGGIRLLRQLNKVLGLDEKDLGLEHYNEALSDPVIIEKQKLNKKYSHDLGNCIYSSAEVHRCRDYYQKQGMSPPIEDRDWSIKWSNIERAQNNANDTSEGNIDYTCDKKTYDRLYGIYAESNTSFASITGVNIKKLGYPY